MPAFLSPNREGGGGHNLSKRDFLKIGLLSFGVLAFSAVTGCAPVDPETQDLFEAEEVSELQKFYTIAHDLTSTFGPSLFEIDSQAIYDACRNLIDYNDRPIAFRSSLWGLDKENTLEIVNNHTEFVIQNGIDIYQLSPNDPLYIPPTKQDIEPHIRRFAATFPLLSIAADMYKINTNTNGGGQYDPKDKSVEELNPQKYPEMGNLVDFHEHGHAAADNFMRFQQFVNLKDFADFETTKITCVKNIIYEWLRLPNDDKTCKDYGLYFSVNDNNLEFFNLAKAQLGFEANFPIEIVVTPNDTVDQVRQKESMQFNFIVHTVGKSLLDGKSDFTDTYDRKDITDRLMRQFFGEVFHYLVGPYQVESAIPHSYSNLGKTGIHVHNLIMHKARMHFFANPALNEDPIKIRESLGLRSIYSVLEDYGSSPMGTIGSESYPWSVYKLPSDTEHNYYYAQSLTSDNNEGVWVKTYREPELDLSSLENIVISYVSINESVRKDVDTGFRILNAPDFNHNNHRNSNNTVGKVITNKIVFSEGVVQDKEFVWINDGSMIKLYNAPTSQLGNLTNAVVFDSLGAEPYYTNSPLIVTDGATFQCVEAFWPNININTPEIYILDTRELGTGKIVVGDINSNGKNGRYELTFSPEVNLTQIRDIQTQYPAAGITFVFNVIPNSSGDHDNLNITCYISPDKNSDPDNFFKFDVGSIRPVVSGTYNS